MSLNEYRTYAEHKGVLGWVWALGIVTGVGVVGYILYHYFVHPGDIILDQYQKILKDILEPRDNLHFRATFSDYRRKVSMTRVRFMVNYV